MLVKLKDHQQELAESYRSVEISAKRQYKFDYDSANHSLREIEQNINSLAQKTSSALDASKVALTNPSISEPPRFANSNMMMNQMHNNK